MIIVGFAYIGQKSILQILCQNYAFLANAGFPHRGHPPRKTVQSYIFFLKKANISTEICEMSAFSHKIRLFFGDLGCGNRNAAHDGTDRNRTE